MRTCENCFCFRNCDVLAAFCREMVFKVRRIDISLVDSLAGGCRMFADAEVVKQVQAAEVLPAAQPMLFVVRG